MQVPLSQLGGMSFTIDPQQRAMRRTCDKIIAHGFLPVPPSGLDAFRSGQQFQRALVLGSGCGLGQRSRGRQQPERALPEVELQLWCLGRAAGLFRTMIGRKAQVLHGFAAEAGAQSFDQVFP